MSLYFPDYDEQQAMAVNCVRTNGGSCEGMSDPSKRAFVTEHGKELTLYPDSMALSGAGGKISLVDDRGLDIISEHGITIIGRSVKFEAPKVTVLAPNGEISLAKGPSRQAQAMATRLAQSASQQTVSANPLALLAHTQAQLVTKALLMPETEFTLSGRFDLMSKGFTHVVGWNRVKYPAYDDAPQEGRFDWGKLIFNVAVGIAVAVAVVAVATVAVAAVATAAKVGGLIAVGVCALSDIGHGNVSGVGTYMCAGFAGAATGAAFTGLSIVGQALGPLVNCAKYGKAVVGVFKVSAFLSKSMAAFDTFVLLDLLENGESGSLYNLNAKLHSNKLYNTLQVGLSVTAVVTGGMSQTMTCFVAGTRVLTATGLVAIEQIKAGDKVISTDPETFETTEKTVLETYVRKDSKLIHLTINGEEIITTETHPFYVKDRGFVNAGELALGDCLLDVNGNVLLVDDFQVEYTDEPTTVYNFQVEDFRTYYVGEHCVWVHNAEYNNTGKPLETNTESDGAGQTAGKGGSKADVLDQNKEKGRAFEQQEFAKFKSQNNNAVEQITVKTSSGVRTRVDAIGLDANGNVVINEYKSSLTAPLTNNQKIAFPEIFESGATVVGKGKGIFSGGYQIPPGTEVTIIRPE